MSAAVKDQMQVELTAEDKTSAAFNNLRNSMRTVQQQLDQLRKSLAGAGGGDLRGLVSGMGDLEKAHNRASESGNNLANTLTRRLVLGYLVAQTKDAARAILGLNSELAKLGDTAARTGFGSGALQGLSFGAQIKGIDPGQFLDSMTKFNQQLDEAKLGLGSLAQLFRANGVAATTTQDAFLKVADLVKNARTDADKFAIAQQAGLPATREMVQFLEQGSAAIQRAAKDAPVITDDAVKRAKEIEEQYNKLWATFTLKGKQAIVEILDPNGWKQAGQDASGYFWAAFRGGKSSGGAFSLSDGAPTSVTGGEGLPRFSPRNTIMAPDLDLTGGDGSATRFNPKPSINVEAELKKIARMQQELSLLGQLTTAEEARRQVVLQLQAANLNGLNIDDKRAEKLKQQAYDQALGVAALKSQADAYLVEANIVGMTTGAAEQYRAVQSVILENRRKGIELAPAEIAYLEQQGKLLADRKVFLEGAKLTDEIERLDPFVAMQKEIANLDEMLAKGSISWEVYERAAVRAAANTASNVLGMVGSLATNLSKLFDNNKALAIAGAVIDTAAGVAKALGAGVPPWNFVAAASVAAAGAAQIATIRNTTKNSAGSISSPGAVPSSSSAGNSSGPAGEAGPQRSVYVNIHGNSFSEEHIRNLIEAINQHGKDGGTKIEIT